jgi:hypothetical protein
MRKKKIDKKRIGNQKAIKVAAVLIVVALAGSLLWRLGMQQRRLSRLAPQRPVATGKPVVTTPTPLGFVSPTPIQSVAPTPLQLGTYSNQQYGFTVSFPGTLHTEMPFNTSYLLSNKWRYGAKENAKGIPVVSIPVVRIERQSTYPRFYNVEVRIGVSTDPRDLQTLMAGPGNGEGPSHDETINGVVFKVFPFQDAATMKYVVGLSYRTVRNNTIYVIEQLKSGSNYRDTASLNDIPDTVLDAYYRQAGDIVKTFRFIR